MQVRLQQLNALLGAVLLADHDRIANDEFGNLPGAALAIDFDVALDQGLGRRIGRRGGRFFIRRTGVRDGAVGGLRATVRAACARPGPAATAPEPREEPHRHDR